MMTTLHVRSLAAHTFILGGTVLLALTLLLTLGTCQAEEAAVKPEDTAQLREQHIEAALLEDASVEFVETPLQDVIDYLKDRHKIEIQLDTKALDAASIGSDTPITRNLKNITLAAALRHVLGPFGLTYVVRDEVLLITTPDAVRQMVDVRVYKVSDLVAANEAVALADTVLRALTGAPPESPRPLPAPAQAGSNGAASGAATSGERRPALNLDFNLVSIEPFRDTLIVRANYQGHKATERLLTELRSKLTKLQAMPAVQPPAPAASSRATR
jgi:hypothetical protein